MADEIQGIGGCAAIQPHCRVGTARRFHRAQIDAALVEPAWSIIDSRPTRTGMASQTGA